MKTIKNISTLHPIDSFGIQRVSLSGIRVERLETRVKPTVSFPHKHDFFQIMIVTSGTGEHLIDFVNHDVKIGQVFMMKPGQMHIWNLTKNIKGFLVEFNFQSLSFIKDSSRLMHDFSYSPDVVMIKDKNLFQEIVKLAEIMLKESETKRELHDFCLQGYLSSFLVNLLRINQKDLKQEKVISLIEKFRLLLEKNFRSQHAVEFYAKQLNTSPKALTMQLTRSVEKPPRKLIQERLLLEAKRYLAFSDLSIAEIGYELGFEDPNYFTRFFRLQEKMSPAQFRKVKQPSYSH